VFCYIATISGFLLVFVYLGARVTVLDINSRVDDVGYSISDMHWPTAGPGWKILERTSLCLDWGLSLSARKSYFARPVHLWNLRECVHACTWPNCSHGRLFYLLVMSGSSGSQLGVLAPPSGARRDFLGCELLCANFSDNTKNNTSIGASGAKMIFSTGRGASLKMNSEPLSGSEG